jgi:group I intron endonuclease
MGIIYKISNNFDNEEYIGQTIGCIYKRFKNHCKPSSSCVRLSRKIQKYGKDNFTIEEIDGANSQSELNYLEDFYICKFNTLAPNGLNLKRGGSNGSICEKSKLKLSISCGSKPFNVYKITKYEGSIKNSFYKVLETEYIGNWTNKRECARELALKISALSGCLNRNGHQTRSYIFIYLDDEKSIEEKILEINKSNCLNNRAISKNKKPFKVYKIIKYEGKIKGNYKVIETEYIGEWLVQSKCANELKISRSKLSNCLKGKRKTHKGYIFKYL